MRPLTSLALLGATAMLAVAASPAQAINGSLKVKASPNKGGSVVLANPSTFTLDGKISGRTPTGDGNQRMHSMFAKLPTQLLFNTLPFKECRTSSFVQTGKCSSSTRLATATVLADGGPDIGVITAKATIYFGTGFSALINVNVDKPAVINEFIVGDLRSSGTQGYGLAMNIPIPASLHTPLPNLHPTVTSVEAKIKTPTKRVKVGKKRERIPMAGIGTCKPKKMNFAIDVLYANATDTAIDTDTMKGSANCRR